MANVDKTQAMINYLLTCPALANNPAFFNFVNAKDNNKQMVSTENDISLNKTYVDGSQLKQFTFVVIDYRSVSYQALVKTAGYDNENVTDYIDVQGIIDWIDAQEKARLYPDFGVYCIVDKIEALSNNPNLDSVDTSVTPALAKYSIEIRVTYLDTTNTTWNKIQSI